jgi:hypothetical protein
MSFEKKRLKLFLFVFTFVLIFGITGSIFLKNHKESKIVEEFSDETYSDDSYDVFPQIVNMPPRSVEVNTEFSFNPKIVPMDDDVKVALLDSPQWLVLDGIVVRGVPDEKGTFSFVLRIERDGRYVDDEFYLVVIDEIDE